ncbi:MAG: hypothetical protein PHS57_05050 [Alphaproteobacteria bacterium]|nr:hypothetical protein [Alphaproteobacteria bacterium]
MVVTPFDYKAFYQSALGLAVLGVLRSCVRKLWGAWGGADERRLFLGCGAFVDPRQNGFCGQLTSVADETFSCFVGENKKPLSDGGFDRLLALHALDDALNLEAFAREAWRVLKGEGQLLLIVPRQGSAWAEKDGSPFADEPAFTKAWLRQVFRAQGFSSIRIHRALYAAPRTRGQNAFLFRMEARFPVLLGFGGGGGVFIVEARKTLFGAIPCAKRSSSKDAEALFAAPLPV